MRTGTGGAQLRHSDCVGAMVERWCDSMRMACPGVLRWGSLGCLWHMMCYTLVQTRKERVQMKMLLMVALVLVLGIGAALAGGDKVRGEKGKGSTTQIVGP
jgi:hypothetical protein